jgi:(2R)-sulfolactate sulfo-lyase subunit alpha
MHEDSDSVGVAVADIKGGEKVYGAFLHGDKLVEATANNDIPLGHKIAMKDISAGEYVMKYDEKIGIATKDIKKGDWVHTHNVRGYRWVKKTPANA